MARINWDGHYIQGLRDLLAYNYTPLALRLLQEYNGGIGVNPEDPNFPLQDVRKSLYQQYANQQYKTPKTLAELQSLMENTVNPAFRGSGSNNFSANAPIKIDDTGEIDPNAPSKLAALTDLLFPLSPQNSGTPNGYGTITDGDKTVTIDSTGISGSGSTSGESEKTPKKESLQKVTSDISTSKKPKAAKTPTTPVQMTRPDYTNVAYSSQVQPVEPAPVQSAEPPIDESYYRYLRNNGWNDFDARRQAIRYY